MQSKGKGIAKAKKAGVYTGAKPRICRDEVLALINAGTGPAAAARSLGISRMSVYRIMGEQAKPSDRAIKRARAVGRL